MSERPTGSAGGESEIPMNLIGIATGSSSSDDPHFSPTITPDSGNTPSANGTSDEFELGSGVSVHDSASVNPALQPTITPEVVPAVASMNLRQRFSTIFGVADDPNDTFAQGVLAHVSTADTFGNGRRKAALKDAFSGLVGPLPVSIDALMRRLESTTDMTPAYIRLQDGSTHGRQVFKLQGPNSGGQGSVHLVVNPALSPTDPDLLQVVKLPGKAIHATINPHTHEFDTLHRAPDQPLDPDIARFNTEAAILRHIEKKGLSHVSPRLIDRTVTAEGTPALVSEFLRGRDLNTFLKNGRTISVQAGYDMMAYLASMLDELHTMEEDNEGNHNGVVHRDLKPANIMITSDGRLKIIDFGLAKYRGAEVITQSGGKTMTNTVAGTGAFMAPEQFGNVRHASYAADVYSLAATMVPLLTGRTVYEGNQIEMAAKHADPNMKPDEALAALRTAGVDPKIVALFERCFMKTVEPDSMGRPRLSRKQTGRPTMQEVRDALVPYTTWAKRDKKFLQPDMVTQGIRTGSVRIEGLLSDNDVRAIGITSALPDGFDGQEAAFLEAFARQYPIQSVQVDTKRKVSGLMGTLIAAGVLTVAAGATYLAMKPGRGEADSSSAQTSTDVIPSGPKEHIQTLPGGTQVVSRQSGGRVQKLILFANTPDSATIPANAGMLTPLLSEGGEVGYAGLIPASECAEMLGIPVDSLNPNFKKNNGTGFILVVDQKTDSSFFVAPGICKRFEMPGETAGERVSYITFDTENDEADFEGYTPNVTLSGKLLSSEDELYSIPQLQEFLARVPEDLETSEQQGNEKILQFATGNIGAMKGAAEQFAQNEVTKH